MIHENVKGDSLLLSKEIQSISPFSVVGYLSDDGLSFWWPWPRTVWWPYVV